jgi:hypothetical protein
MKRAAIYDDNGDVVCFVTGSDENIAANTEGKNYILVPEDESLSAGFWRVADGQLHTSVTNKSEISVLRQRKWEAIKRERDAEELSPFTWNDMTFDADRVSQSRIQGAAQLATISPEFEVEWTLADNTTTTLDKTDIYGVASALGQRVSLIHQYARSLREAINHATNESTLNDINWNL